MSRDRFLIGILVGIGVLVAAALILFFIQQGKAVYGDESTPEGVTRNYLLALQKRDYERAYGYLAEFDNKPDFTSFRQPFLSYQGNDIANTAVEIGVTSPDPSGDMALVQVTLLRGNGDPFNDIYRDRQSVTLVLQNGAWKIQSAPQPFWDYSWGISK